MSARHPIAAALLLGLAALPCPAGARPADCLVQVEGRTLINGPCDFAAEAGGDFTVTLGPRKAQVMVDPGARQGRAFYEDSASGEPPGVADVRRDGACWGQPRAIRVCAWQPGERPAAYRNLPAAR
ncbi:hypothetical protein KTR66_18485 [Roseococcus sp. SDR]|uniref:hypothetical protein n=1 Tax=Roseococcus sp. SDR TaxID=2835532 RepID=UPI001BCC7D4A|nr:hypothetical protein [Roseococcus sp. SDR]MBS7791994.1 hypothetical protein [Roseococcus sp. SDR]MBV1847308.1 hypothetical protein [Roseococcus sp. SDR]